MKEGENLFYNRLRPRKENKMAKDQVGDKTEKKKKKNKKSPGAEE